MRYSFIIIGLSLFITSCGAINPFSKKSFKGNEDTFEIGTKIEEGMASWYGPNFHGQLTANGEIYDMYGLTAAHRTLPFGTILKVKNLENGRAVQVRINDRGPYAKNRIIDLSKKAASEIGMIGPGTAHVAIILLEGEINKARLADLKIPTFTVQLASFYKKNKALKFTQKLEGSRIEVFKIKDSNVYRIFYGTFADKSKASDKQKELQKLGFTGYVKQIQN